MRPEDIADIVEVSDPRVSPDGTQVAFVVTKPDLESNRYQSAIWIAGVDGGLPPVPYTSVTGRANRPRWSPDGTAIAYVDHPEDTGAVLVVSDVEDDSTLELLRWPEEIEDLVWSPDATRLVFSARQRDEAHYGVEKDRDRPSRRIDRLQYRQELAGWTIDRPRHIFVIAADGSEEAVTSLSDGPYQDAAPAVSPDGSTVVFSSARTPTWDTDLSTHLYAVGIEGGEPRQLTSGSTLHGQPSWSPDGSQLAYVWGDRHSMMRHGQVGLVAAPAAAPDLPGDDWLVTTALDLHCVPYLALARDPVWDTAESFLFQVDESGNVPVYRGFVDGRRPEKVIGGDRQVTGFDHRAGVLAFTATDAVTPTELFVVSEGAERCLTSFSHGFTEGRRIASPERFIARSKDGTEIEAWVLRPHLPEGDRCPVLLNIHGGPFSQYGNKLFDEFQVQVAAGYAVVYSNPRGSSGYSEAFARATRGPNAAEDPGTGWGGADHDDLIAVIDAALDSFPFLDRERQGVIGGSYGGYMTSWMIGHTDRFKAAVSERAVNNMLTFAHTSDIGAHFPAGYIGSSHLEEPDEFIRQSPVTYWQDIRTPVLILHSENDLRCPIEQAEDLFVRLKLSGRDVEFVRFPGEGHELSRSGAPRHRVERHRIILDWFDRKLR